MVYMMLAAIDKIEMILDQKSKWMYYAPPQLVSLSLPLAKI